MKQVLITELKKKGEEVALIYSNPSRAMNINKETFVLEEIRPLSETTAIMLFKKNNGKKAMSFAYYVNGRWLDFFPSESHAIGMQRMAQELLSVDEFNVREELRQG